jgi:hypothetical protein
MHGVQAQRGVRVTGFEQDADGAHSAVRRALGLTFEEQYMLGDVEVDWSAPRGYGIRSTHETDGKTDDALVCIPLPGRGRYRMSMLVPDELTNGDTPQLHHIQAVLDRLSPEPTTARNLRWSSGEPCVAPGKASAPTRPTSATSSAAKPSCSSTTRAARSSPEPLGRRHRAPTARVSVPRTRRA